MATETQTVAITCADGSLAVMQFVTNDGFDIKREATDEAIAAEVARSVPDAISWRKIDAKDLPADRTFRGAWRDDGEVIDHDIDAARYIWADRARLYRASKFAALDVEWMRALSAGDTAGVAAVEAKRQALRDAPQTILEATKDAKTVDDIAAVWPEALA